MNLNTRIKEMARARYSGLVVQSAEDLRIEQIIASAAKGLGYDFRRWTTTMGWQDKTGGDPDTANESAFGGALTEIASMPNRTLLVMHVFNEAFRDPVARQALREAVSRTKTESKVIVLVGIFEVPADLEKHLVVIPFDLPNREELAAVARALCEGSDVKPNGELPKTVDAALGLTAVEAEDAFALSLVRSGRLDPDVVLSAKKESVRKNGVLEVVDVSTRIEDVGGLEELKAWLKLREKATSPQAREFGLEPLRGVMICGIPGTGKSLIAKAIASAWRQPLIRLDMGRVMGSLVGQSEQQMRSALKTAEAIAPAVLWIDEFEKATAGMGGGGGDGGTTQRVMGTLLTWMQERTAPVTIVATANNVLALPPEMLRKGRWDEIFFVDLPDERERSEILRVHLTKRKRADFYKNEKLMSDIVQRTNLFTGSEIEEVVKIGLWKAFGAGRDLNEGDLIEACEETMPLSKTMKENIDRLRELAKGRFRTASRRYESNDVGTRRRVITSD